MLRVINFCLLFGLVALAFVNYEVKYQSRGLDRDIVALNHRIDRERDSITMLRAEWSLLNRPGRIERLAKRFLDLQPLNPKQIISLNSVTQAQFDTMLGAPRAPTGAAAGNASVSAPAPTSAAAPASATE